MLNKIMEEQRVAEWSYEDFLAFMLMYAAYSDNIVKPEELEAIEEKVGAEKTKIANKIMSKLNDQDRIELMLSFKDKFYPTEEDQTRIYQDMKRIYFSDGSFSQVEKIALMYLKKLI